MNGMKKDTPHDKSQNSNLADDLATLGQAYQQLKSEEPPELLDQAVLSSAHRAVEKKAGWMDFGWTHGLTTAAVVVLALTIILTQRQPPVPASVSSKTTGLASPAPAPVPASESEFKSELKLEPGGLTRKLRSAEPGYSNDQYKESRTEPDSLRQAMPAASTLGEAMPEAQKPAKAMATDLAAARDVQLQIILELKRAGDDRWKAALKAFIERYPDYPLPDELKN